MILYKKQIKAFGFLPRWLFSPNIYPIGGVLFIRTTNRSRFSFTGVNWEFTTRFYNWFPRIVKESYIFTQLHYKPELARYSPGPAAHWFNFSDLCRHGREVGFSRFYSPYDLLYLIPSKGGRTSRFFSFNLLVP
jgi:hypothetical protein